MNMKTTSSLIQIIALSACLATHLDVAAQHMAGVRRALQTIEGASSQIAAHGAQTALAANFALNGKTVLHRA
jgi:hypothetical protein